MNLYDSPGAYISMGGVVVGLAILGWYLTRWWWKGRKGKGKGDAEAGGKRDWRALIPLAAGMALGSLASACTGGVLGWAVHWISRANAAGGDTAVRGTTGAETDTIAQGQLDALSGGGAIVTMLLLVAVVALWAKLPVRMRKELAAGAWAGASLALSDGVAGIYARTVVPLANSIGDSIMGAL